MSVQKRVDIIEKFLISKLRKTTSIHYFIVDACINEINRRKGIVTIRDLASRHDLSERALQRIFKKMVGISTKQYANFKKLENGIQLCRTEEKLTESCYSAGYYDQSDFIKTIKKYTGYTPSQLKTI